MDGVGDAIVFIACQFETVPAFAVIIVPDVRIVAVLQPDDILEWQNIAS